jgi:hypothetical protein
MDSFIGIRRLHLRSAGADVWGRRTDDEQTIQYL